MNIAWLYLDKRSAAISALKDYESMNYILENVPADMATVRERMTCLGGSLLSDMPKGTRNPCAMENKIVKALDTISVLQERYQRALEYRAWFQPAWKALSGDEQFVLSRFYLNDEAAQVDSVLEICEYYHIERTSAYKKKDRALAHLTLLLYGK